MANLSFRPNLDWAAPYREWCSHFHHSMALASQLNILKESVGLVILRPRHFWDCKWKSRCWDTHFHNMSSVLLHSLATIQSCSGLIHWPVFSWTMVNGSFPESRQTKKVFQDSELCGQCALAPAGWGECEHHGTVPTSALYKLWCTTRSEDSGGQRGTTVCGTSLCSWAALPGFSPPLLLASHVIKASYLTVVPQFLLL